MKLKFKGSDGSMGFKRNKTYDATTNIANGWIWVHVKEKGLRCPYTNMESILENFDLIIEPDGWDDF